MRAFALEQKLVDGLSRRRLGEQEALHLVAAGEPQQNALLLGLHALAQNRETEGASERHDGLDDDAAVGGLAERDDETAVDLELVEWEALEIAEVGIAGAEVVERDADAELVQILNAFDHLVRIVDQHAFGD